MRQHIRAVIAASGRRTYEWAAEIGVTQGYLSAILQDGSRRLPSEKVLEKFGLVRTVVRPPVQVSYQLKRGNK